MNVPDQIKYHPLQSNHRCQRHSIPKAHRKPLSPVRPTRSLRLFLLWLMIILISPVTGVSQHALFGIQHLRSFNWNQRKEFLFSSHKGVYLSQIFRTMPDVTFTQTNPWTTDADLDSWQHRSQLYLTTFAYRWSPRVNLLEYDDMASLSFSTPLQFGSALNLTDIWEEPMNLQLIVPVLLQANFFKGSTKARLDRYGGTIGIGYLSAMHAPGITLLVSSERDFQVKRHGFWILQLLYRGPSGGHFFQRISEIEYWIGINPRSIEDGSGNRSLHNYFFSIGMRF